MRREVLAVLCVVLTSTTTALAFGACFPLPTCN